MECDICQANSYYFVHKLTLKLTRTDGIEVMVPLYVDDGDICEDCLIKGLEGWIQNKKSKGIKRGVS